MLILRLETIKNHCDYLDKADTGTHTIFVVYMPTSNQVHISSFADDTAFLSIRENPHNIYNWRE